MKPIAVITSDLHIVRNTWRHRTEITGDAEAALLQITDTAEMYGIPIIAAGDIFDTKRPTTDVLALAQAYLSSIKGYYILGNHDKVKPDWMDLLTATWVNLDDGSVPILHTVSEVEFDNAGWTRVIAEQREVKQFRLFGIDYQPSDVYLSEELQKLKLPDNSFNILVLHQGTRTMIPVGDIELEHGMLPSNVDLVICGHVHNSLEYTLKNVDGKDINVISPGSPYITALGESKKKYVYILLEDGSVWKKRLTTRRVLSVDLQDFSEDEVRKIMHDDVLPKLREVPEHLFEAVKTPILRVIHNTTIQGVVEASVMGIPVHIFYKSVMAEVEDAPVKVRYDGTSHSEYAQQYFQTVEQSEHVKQAVNSLLDGKSYEEVKEGYFNVTA